MKVIVLVSATALGASLATSGASQAQGTAQPGSSAQQGQTQGTQPQRNQSDRGTQGNPALKDPQPGAGQQGSGRTGGAGGTAARLEPGANSFTEGQARSRLEEAGFQQVTNLRKDEQGIWRGEAQRGGRSVNVGLDYKGTIAAD